MNTINYKKNIFWLIAIATIVRLFLSWAVEFGNDEVYYRLYAMYPDWSHFDHPLMVGIVMQITTLNLLLDSELFFRLSSVIFAAINTWIIYRIGSSLKDERTGFFSAILYTTSIYASIISGIFILPDSPQSFFWLWAVYLIINSLPKKNTDAAAGKNLMLAGFAIGLGILSKYTTIFLWFGAGLYILIYNRSWLRSWKLYTSVIISIVLCLPILIWNIQNDFISFTFHSDRIDMVGYSLRPDYFLTEFIGEIMYNNPINYILILLGIIYTFKGKSGTEPNKSKLLLLLGLPLIITFLLFSLFRSTLPHWTAPGYTTLIPLGAAFVSVMHKNLKRRIPISLIISLSLISVMLIASYLQINYGIIKIDNTTEYNRIGKNDPTLDMYGYRELGKEFSVIYKEDVRTGSMPADAIIVGDNWFPLANFDYYVAEPNSIKTYGIGRLERIHKYAWINQLQGGFTLGSDAYYITDSREYDYPDFTLYRYFEKIIPADTIQIYRNGTVAKRVFIFRMKNLQEVPTDVLNQVKPSSKDPQDH